MKNMMGKSVKISLSLLIVAAVCIGYASMSEGRVVRRVYPEAKQTFTPWTYFTGKIGIFIPNDDNFPDGLEGYSSGFFAGGGIGFRATPNFAIEGEVDYYEADFGLEDLSVVPILVNLRAIYPGGLVEPYIEGGGGIYFAEFEFPIGGGQLETDTGAGFGAHFGAGVDFNVNPSIILGIEFRWFFAEPDFSDVFGEDPNVGGFVFNFLLRGRF